MTKQNFKPDWDEIDSNIIDGFTHKFLCDAGKDVILYGIEKPKNQHVIIVRLEGNHLKEYKKLNFKNILLDYQEDFLKDKNKTNIVIKLLDTAYTNQFDTIVSDIAQALQSCDNSSRAMRIVINQISKWHKLLSTYKDRLSKKEIIGLYGELIFLNNKIDQYKKNISSLINSWQGPDRKQHDFIFEKCAIEVKSIATNSDDVIHISSEDQLNDSGADLYLKLFYLKHSNDTKVLNLNELVTSIRDKIKGEIDMLDFGNQLEKVNYHFEEDYNDSRYEVKKEVNYIVNEDFPKLTKKNTPNEISSIKYQLNVTNLTNFICDEVNIFK